MSDKFNIVCISTAPWDYPIWTNRQHIMARLARQHNVLYVYQPTSTLSAYRRLLMGQGARGLFGLKRVSDTLTVFVPPILPFGSRSEPVLKANIAMSGILLRRLIARLHFKRYVLWFYDPEGSGYLRFLRPHVTCYDCVDEFAAMPSYAGAVRQARVRRLESQLVSTCDLVFTTSVGLYETRKRLNPATFLVENVGDFEHFNAAAASLPRPHDFPQGCGRVVGFVGALDRYKVDFSLIEELAARRPDVAIVLVGAQQDSSGIGSGLPKAGNIHYLGRKAYAELPGYMAQFDVCIIPYVISPYTSGVFPIKLFECLATGKPVVATALPALARYRHVVSMATTSEGFVDAVGRALDESGPDARIARIEVARANSWEHRASRLVEHVSRTWARKLL